VRPCFSIHLHIKVQCNSTDDSRENDFYCWFYRNPYFFCSAPRVSLYFGHAETLLPLQALLGIFQDDKELTASNFKFFKDKRCFRSSLFASFAANIALVQYKCKGEQESHSDWPRNLDSHMVQLFANEHVVPLPFTDKSAISMHEFETHYYQYVHHCDFNMICENGPHDELWSFW